MSSYRKPLSSIEREEYLERERASWSNPAYHVAKARYQLMTHMNESLDPGVMESLDSELFWRACRRGGVMAVYNECLDKGCTVAQLFDLDDKWDLTGSGYDMRPTIESYCHDNPELVQDYLTLLKMKIEAFDGIESVEQLDPSKGKAIFEFEMDLDERISRDWDERVCKA